jgi:hypothetical protein
MYLQNGTSYWLSVLPSLTGVKMSQIKVVSKIY